MPAVALISDVPAFVSPEEYTSIVGQTPPSFSDIPPVLQLKEDNVTVIFDPPLDGFSSEDGARGTILIIQSVLAFMSTTGRGFQIEYPSITLHAVSRAASGPSIYCQLDESSWDPEPTVTSDDETSDMRELSIVPQNIESLEPIFEALSSCAALHPDKATSSDDEMDDAFIDTNGDGFEPFTGEGDQELSQAGRVRSDFINDNRYAPY
ncbi:regulator of volume decrease after cellular swelling-domain-containing protein [Mycena crocata]|nr:regulator of volume decrease after cellular swelling-domain-containing protein [Mycena crocata]